MKKSKYPPLFRRMSEAPLPKPLEFIPRPFPRFDLPRSCEVEGRAAVFHRWVEVTDALFQIDICMSRENVEKAKKLYLHENIVSPGCTAKQITATLALVEYKDGTVSKVKPEKVCFTDWPKKETPL